MALRIKYNAGAGDVSVDVGLRGPQNFTCSRRPVKHVNISTEGDTETVTERVELVISFSMQAMMIGDDLPRWDALMAWAQLGNIVKLYPDVALFAAEYYDVLDESGEWKPVKQDGVGIYAFDFTWRILPTAQAPTGGASQVLKRYYGIA